jgi:polysaccharide chain length determinant protein (PEP-CTERM system associated)
MVRNGEIGLADVKRVLRRYWWIVPIAVLGCGALAFAAAFILPKRFTSTTLVLVDQPTVPAEYVRPVITEDLNLRLSSMQEQILSRTRLQPIIDKFGLYAEDRGKVHMDDLLDRLRAAIKVEPMAPMPGTENRQLPGFYVKVTFPNPQIAQQICTEVTSMFMEQNARDREGQATRTTSFLSSQLDEAKAKLDEQDAKLAQFKRQHLGELPEESEANLSLLTGLNTQLEANTQQLSHAQQEKTYTETLLSQQLANWKATLTGQNPVTADQQIASLQEQLAAMEARYTPQHPDVIKLKNDIEELQKRNADPSRAPAVSNPSVPTTEPAHIQELRARLRQADLLIADLTKRQGQIQEEIRVIQGRVQATPVVEQQFKEITRNYQTALDFYNELLKKRDNSAMATDLEHQQESEQFRVLDPPSLPSEPSFPKKPLFAAGGLGVGLALSLALLYLLAIGDKSLHTERDVELALRLPVLALIPALEPAGTGADRSGTQIAHDAMDSVK